MVTHAPCPDCGSKDNLAIYDDGGEHCFSPQCSRHVPGGGGDEEESAPEEKPIPAQFTEQEITALPGRCLTKATCARYGYARVTDKQGRRWQAAPYQDARGEVVAWKLRSSDKHFQWAGQPKQKLPFFGQHLQGRGKMLVVTEGELDALSVSQALGNTWPAVSLPHGAGPLEECFTEGMSWLDSFERVVLCFDMDTPGREAAEKAARLLPPGKAAIVTLPVKDASDMLQEGREDELKRAIWNAPTWAPKGIVMGDAWLDALKGAHKPTLAHFPFPILDGMTRGMRAGEIILMVGASGGGKSTLCRGLVWGLAQDGVKTGVLSLEETIDGFMVPLVGYGMGKNLRMVDEDPTRMEGFSEALEKVQDTIVGYDDDGSRDPDQIFNTARYMHQACGCSVVVLDHLTILLASQDSNDRVGGADRLMARLEGLVKRTGMTLIVVMHLRKTADGKSFEQGKVPTMSDIRGSGLIAGFSHTIVARSRDQETNDGGQLHLLKCRLGGTGKLGPADELVFDESVGMLRSVADPAAGLCKVEDY